MKKKLKILVLFGGKSAEHEISVISARNIIKSLNKSKYTVIPMKINKDGRFDLKSFKKADVVFPVLHGPFGEDGSMQGLIKILDVPFVGPGVLGSAVSMDKEITKRVLRDAGIKVGGFEIFRIGEKISYAKISKKLGKILFIKPANMGSSVGISKVENEKEFKIGVKKAFQYDTKIIVEKYIKGQEIECAVLGNDKPEASIPGEIVPINDFYSYKAKYLKKNGADLLIPAKLPLRISQKVREIAKDAFKVLNCEGMSRVDFFVTDKDIIYVNEINTIPGFTSISMYPKLWAASGLPIEKLLDRLIELSIERYKREKKLKTTFN